MPHRKFHRLLISLVLVMTAWQVSCTGQAAATDRIEAAASPVITLALMGDVMLGRGVHPSPDSFSLIKPELQTADLALANLESPLTTAARLTPADYNLCADPKYASLLAESGFDLFTLANNHRLDCGTAGLTETQQVLNNAGLGVTGPGSEPVIIMVKGVKLGFLAFDGTTPDFDLEGASRAVRLLKESGALVIVSMHWGKEYQSGHTAGQEEITRKLAGAGAVLIWGHHPHVLQKSAWIGKTLVLYSLGNAMFDQQGLASTRQSALVVVQLEASGVKSMKAFPFVIDPVRSRIEEADADEQKIILNFFK